MMYLAHYLYVSPEGTFDPETEDKTIYSGVRLSADLDVVIEFLFDIFDAQDMFNEDIEPEMRKELETGFEYFCDDYSAGQWFRVTKITNEEEIDVESVL